MSYNIYHEDCLEGMKRIESGSVDMILTDLPYGITDAPFDIRLPFAPMWKEFYRVIKRNAAIALFANGKFLIELAASNLKDYRYKWVWQKKWGSGFLNAKKMPLKAHEDILIFYQQLPTYNPQWTYSTPYKFKHLEKNASKNYGKKHDCETICEDGRRYPLDRITFAGVNSFGAIKNGVGATVHPTQKPTDLLEYLERVGKL